MYTLKHEANTNVSAVSLACLKECYSVLLCWHRGTTNVKAGDVNCLDWVTVVVAQKADVGF